MPKRQSEAKRSEKKNENEANFFFSSFRETKRKGSKTVSVSHCFASKREKKLEAKMGHLNELVESGRVINDDGDDAG